MGFKTRICLKAKKCFYCPLVWTMNLTFIHLKLPWKLDLKNKNIVFYDGQCALCDKAIQFLLRRDKKELLYFAMLQEDFSRDYLAEYGIDTDQLKTFIYSRKGKVFSKSDAALEAFRDISIAGKFFNVFKIVPRFIRNGIYDWVAKNRYKWFGQSDSCIMPPLKWSERLITPKS